MDIQGQRFITECFHHLDAGFLPVLRGRLQDIFDQRSIEEFGFPSLTLMENAGRGAACIIEQNFGPIGDRKVVICCGSGNNGGDGLVVARTLYNWGATVEVYLLKPPTTLDAKKNLEFLYQLHNRDASGRLNIIVDPKLVSSCADIYIDALFGVGLNRPLEGDVVNIVKRLNAVPSPVIALDIPSGLHADTGIPMGKAVQAEMTITFSAYKPGLLLEQGPEYAGNIELVDIGLPLPSILQQDASQIDWISTDEAVSSLLPSRSQHAHKYSAGMVLIIGGSTKFSGAPMLAALAAARAGAGYVACAVPEYIQSVLSTSMTEIPAIGLPQNSEGGIDLDASLSVLNSWLEKANSIVIGPGLGRHPSTESFIHSILQIATVPIVVDADALHIAATHLRSTELPKDWILTPHAGEFAQMTGEHDISDRLESAHRWSSAWNCTLVLKGNPSIISHHNSDAIICGTGNAALATAGTGDILAGLCGGMLAQGCDTRRAAVIACHVGGQSSDLYAINHHSGTMIASDMYEGIVESLTSLENR
ncbi:MAG: NAD(P)H-hydrate dehydratase [Bacteroidetes bacterium]|nr:NAD(P)H-hydrate dehydratase [Bacteroidota bacterium]